MIKQNLSNTNKTCYNKQGLCQKGWERYALFPYVEPPRLRGAWFGEVGLNSWKLNTLHASASACVGRVSSAMLGHAQRWLIATYCPSWIRAPRMQADTKAVHLPSPAARDALFVRSASLCMEQPFREKPADSSYGPYQSTSSRLSLHLTARASIAASTFCQSRPSSLLQETLTDCEATDRRDMDEQCIRGRWSSTPRWCDGEALMHKQKRNRHA
jgi:hypothetical protein